MKDRPNESDEKLEAMLQRWGADQAAEGAAQQMQPPPRPKGLWLRTAVVAAAAVIVAVLATAYVVEEWNKGDLENALGRAKGLREKLDPLNNEAAALRRQVNDARAKAGAAQTEAAQAATRYKVDLTAAQEKQAALQTDLDNLRKQLTEKEGEYARQIEAARAKSVEAEGKVLAATARMAEMQKSLRTLQNASVSAAGTIADMQKRLHAANSELLLLRDQYDKQVAARTQAERQVMQLKVDLARAAKAVGPAPDEPAASAADKAHAASWQSRKRQARQERLLSRVARLRPTVGTPAARNLIDRLEVLLTRLELLDVNDAGQVRAFLGLLRGANISSEIDSILTSSQLPVPVRSWLLEAKALLAETRRVS